MKKIDMRGTKWNRLTIPEDAIPEKRNKVLYWPCICDCGNTCLINGSLIRSGKTKSCGCYQKERASQASIKDLTGQVFNRLAVLEKDNIKKENYWICKCSCGKITSVRGIDLKRGQVKSCGCLLTEHIKKYNFPPLDLQGQTFNKLTVIYRITNNAKGKTMWHCKCECGNECDVEGSNLINGNTKSCGCIKSFGNMNIDLILNNSNIIYKKEYAINIENKYYKYDFAIYDENKNIMRLIEFDGEQHYYPTSGWNTKEKYKQQNHRDFLKNQYALSHNIPLVRIPYWERDNITLEMIMGDQYLVKKE